MLCDDDGGDGRPEVAKSVNGVALNIDGFTRKPTVCLQKEAGADRYCARQT